MKRYVLLTGILSVILFMGCSKIKDLANLGVDIPYSQTITLPDNVWDTTTLGPLPLSGVPISLPVQGEATNSATYISQYNTSTDKIVSLNLKSLNLTINQPAGANFDFLDSVSIYISATGLPNALLAYKGSIAKGLTTVSLDTTNLDLKPYFLKDTMYLQTNAVFRQVPPSNASINLNSTFHMIYNPLD